jgi:hypothetical protein
MTFGIENRNEVLKSALLLENMTSTFLATLLGIENYRDTKTLGNKSGSISFNQKVDLLIEIGALSKDNRSKFQAFMEIRNQFMHNIEADTYEKCFNFLDGKEKFILKLYPQSEELSTEQKLRLATRELGKEISILTVNLIKKVEEKISRDVRPEILEKSQKAFFNSLEQLEPTLNDYFEKEIEKNTSFDVSRLKSFGTDIRKLVLALWKSNFKELTKNGEKKE